MRDLYFVFLPPGTRKHARIIRRVAYYLAKRGRNGMRIDEIFAAVGEGAALSAAEKNAVRAYLQKLKAYGLAAEGGGKWYPKFPILPVKVVEEIIELHENELAAKYSPNTVKLWKQKKRYPELNELATALMD